MFIRQPLRHHLNKRGLFEQKRMPFGIANAPATFQRLMSSVFREDMLKILIAYLDDIII